VNEIDKKIARLTKQERTDILKMNKEMDWLINQLVACRESYATLYQRMKLDIEHRIKEACKEKAMEWWDEQIKTHNQPNLYIMSKNSLKKAIDEAEVGRYED